MGKKNPCRSYAVLFRSCSKLPRIACFAVNKGGDFFPMGPLTKGVPFANPFKEDLKNSRQKKDNKIE